ncbi:MAG: hypothetical protein IKZ95_05095 [Lachnospiraceae bacterium]|nr:hypothetical protein [Lachnospiraceae bacterium]
MENEENKNNEILEEYVEQRYDGELEELAAAKEAAAAEESAPAESALAEEPEVSEATAPSEKPIVVEESTPVEEPKVSEEPAPEEEPAAPEEEEAVASEEEPAAPEAEEVAEEETTEAEEVPEAEAPVEAQDVPEEEAPVEAEDVPEEEVQVTEETAEAEETVPEEVPVPEEEATEIEEPTAEEETVEAEEPPVTEETEADDVSDLIIEEVILDEPVVEKAVPVVEETAEEETVPEEEPAETTEETPTQEATPTAETPETKQEEQEKPAEKPEKTNKGGHILKAIGVVLILLLIFVPAVFFLVKGETFKKGLIDFKKGLSRTYESYYRKEVFPKLSAAFVPQWAKQMKLEEEKAAEEARKKAEEEKKEGEKQPKDILDGVPQVPEGLEYFPLYIEDHMIVYGRDDWLYTAEGTSLEYFAGTNVLSEEEMAEYARRLDALNEICKAKGVELVMEVGPNKEQVYPEHFPSVTVENKNKRLLILEEYLRDHCSVPFVYPIRELAANKDQFDTYWKYDTHWNSTGAFIGMKAIYQALGRPVNDKESIMREEPTNRGDLAGITGYVDLYTDYITEYKPSVSVGREAFYEYEYDIDDYGVRYTSTSNTGNKLLVCGDSYRVSLAAHMCKDYQITDVIHRDIISTDVAAARFRALSEGDTMVLICVERWDYKMFDVIGEIIAVMQE